jgi:hypothetical protein
MTLEVNKFSKKLQAALIILGVSAVVVALTTSYLLQKNTNLPEVRKESIEPSFKIPAPEDGSLQINGVSFNQIRAKCEELEKVKSCEYEKVKLKEIDYQAPMQLKSMKSVKFSAAFIDLKTGKESQNLEVTGNELIAKKPGRYRVTIIGDSNGFWQFILDIEKKSIKS